VQTERAREKERGGNKGGTYKLHIQNASVIDPFLASHFFESFFAAKCYFSTNSVNVERRRRPIRLLTRQTSWISNPDIRRHLDPSIFFWQPRVTPEMALSCLFPSYRQVDILCSSLGCSTFYQVQSKAVR
jgi:hypothetical protein